MNPIGGESVKPSNLGGMPPSAPAENVSAIPGTEPVVNSPVDPDIAKLQSTVDAAAAKVAGVPATTPTEPLLAEAPLTPQEQFNKFNAQFAVADKPVVNVSEGTVSAASPDTMPVDPNIVAGAKILAEAPAGDSSLTAKDVPPQPEQIAKTPEEFLQEEVKTAIKLGAEEQEKKINEAVNKFLKTVGENRAKTALS